MSLKATPPLVPYERVWVSVREGQRQGQREWERLGRGGAHLVASGDPTSTLEEGAILTPPHPLCMPPKHREQHIWAMGFPCVGIR